MLRLFHLREAAAGFHDAHEKEQHQKRKSYRLQSTVDIHYDRPNGTALEAFGSLCYELPYLR